MFKRMLNTRSLCVAAVLAALYAALTLAIPVLAYGPWQCRFSEALTVLPLLFPEAVPGLFIGCIAANLLSPVGVWDVVFGSLATLLAAIGTWKLRDKPILAVACPVISNGVIVGLMLSVVYALPALLTMLQVAAGEALAVLVGYLLLPLLKKSRITELVRQK